ncbi:MAG: PQQ-binding-like beta-propeller repeat protein [Gemmataceae bacterium]
MSVRASSFVFALLFTGAALAGPNDWPQWRGQNRDGKSPEKGLLKTWPKGGPTKAWTATNLGSGFASPSVADGKVFGMGSRDGKDGVFALNEATGKELWFTPLDASRNPNQNVGPSSTPTFSNGKLYAVTNNNGVIARLDAKTGKIDWQKSYVSDFGSSTPIWGFCDSVLVDGDVAICVPSGSKGAIVALKADSGEVKWAAQLGKIDNQRGGGGYSSPMKTTVGGIPMYIGILDQPNGAIGVHADTGKLLWQHKNAAYGGVAQIPTPIVEGDRVFISTAYGGGSALLQLSAAGEKVNVKEIWSAKNDPMNHHGNMILIDGKVYFGHGQNKGIPVCYDFKTGEKVWHADREPQGANGSAAYSYADGLLYIRYTNGLMTLVKPSPNEDEHKIVSQFNLPPPNDKRFSQSWAHPVIANGKMYIRDHNVLYCYNIKATTN